MVISEGIPPLERYLDFIGPLIEKGEVEFHEVAQAELWLWNLGKLLSIGKARSYFIEKGGRVVAHGGLFLFREKEFFVAVSEEMRGKGLGSAILERCRAEGDVVAFCKEENVQGREFFIRKGGKILGNSGGILKFSLAKDSPLKTLSKNNSQKPAYNVVVMAEEKNTLEELQEKKRKLIERVKAATKKLKYKKIELEALEQLIKDYDEEEVQRLQRTLKRLEFKIQTNALTSKVEKDIIKKIVEIEKKLAKWRPKIRAKRKKSYVEKDIEQLEKEIEQIEAELKDIRAKIKDEARKKSAKAMAEKKGVSFADEVESTVELTDIAVFEDA